MAQTGIINTKQYDLYAANWVKFIGSAGPDELQQAFQVPGFERLACVSFSIDQLVWLLSPVGIQGIKARFVLVPDANDQLRFGLVLFATDAQGRASAYHLGASAEPQPAGQPQGLLAGGRGTQIPDELAALWLKNWQAAPELTAALFSTSNGPLEGYDFAVGDLLSPLVQTKTFAGKSLYVSFGLHAYYPAVEEPKELAYTFGLALRVAAPGSDDPSYDLSSPYPPGM